MTTSNDKPTEAPALEVMADGTHRVRVRYGKERSRFRIPSTDSEFAAARAVVLVEMGAALGHVPSELAKGLLTRAGAADGAELEKLKAAVQRLAAPDVKVQKQEEKPRAAWTMRELGEAWTGGTLAKEYPDQIRSKSSATDDVSRLKSYVYPVIGRVLVRDVTLTDAERVMAQLTRKRGKRGAPVKPLGASTRRHVALVLSRLLALAVYPLKLRTSNPIPKGFVPKAGKRKAMAYLYPEEDRALLACNSIPVRERLLYGFLVREGCRVSEALGLRWSDVDLERGAMRLEKNKTEDPRAWALSPGVAAALAHFRGKPQELVFEPPADPIVLARVLRKRLREAKVERPELLSSTAERIALRVHDLRGSFVTVALANGRSEAWVSDRTGHRSSQMIARYKRAARTVEELKLGDWTPLDVALGLGSSSAPVATLAQNDNRRRLPAVSGQGAGQIVGHRRLELRANGLRVRCSTN